MDLHPLRAPGEERAEGIQTLIGDDYAAKLYGHPLVSTLAKKKKLPPYIGSGTFASALVDVLAHGEDGKPIVGMEDKAAGFVDNVSDDPCSDRPSVR